VDVGEVESYCRQQGMLYGYPDADAVCNADLLEAPVDILILAAAENQITATNAERVRAGIVVELAENGITSAGHEVLNQRGILVIPESLANAGAVIAAFLEWTQAMRLERLSAEEVQLTLKSRVANAWRDLRGFARAGVEDLREKALHLGVSRVAETVRLVG
jgi:glutamate dehydrogenase (NAD(P)+)